MHVFQVWPDEEGLTLDGGQLEDPLRYPPGDIDAVLRVVGFLSQREGSTLRILDWEGKLVATKSWPAGVPPAPNSMQAGLRGDGSGLH